VPSLVHAEAVLGVAAASRSTPHPEPGNVQSARRRATGVTVASASATLARECAARDGHFIAAYAVACWYQVTIAGSGRFHAAGSPVSGSNSRPIRAARTSSAR